MCPMNWKTQPTTKSASAQGHNPPMNRAAIATSSETAIIGIPMVWQARLIGWVCPLAYSAIHSSLVRFPSIADLYRERRQLRQRGVVFDVRRRLHPHQRAGDP